MREPQHSTVREGLMIGLLGAVLAGAWYLICDTAAGRPLHTFNTLGGILLQGDVNPGTRAVDGGAVAGFLLLHFVLFVLAAMGLTLLAHLASRNLSLRMGVWLGVVVAFCFLTGMIFMLNVSTEDRLPLWEVLGASLIGVGSMVWMLWRRHPRLGRSLDTPPLGDEVRAPPHAPGGPRV
jgi:hypothetical protein